MPRMSRKKLEEMQTLDPAAMPSPWMGLDTGANEGMLEAEAFDASDDDDASMSLQGQALDVFDDMDLDNETAFSEGVLNPQADTAVMMPQAPVQSDMAWQGGLADYIQAMRDAQATSDAGLGKLEKYVQDFRKQPRKIDYTAAAAFADYLAPGGKSLEAAKALRPMSEEERALKSVELENLLQQQRQAGSKIPLELLKAELGSQAALARALSGQGRQARFEEAQDLKKEDKMTTAVDKVSSEFKRTQEDLTLAERAVRDGDVRVVQMVISSIARNVGEQKGSLSDGDVGRTMPPDIATNVAQLESYLGKTSKISPELQGAFLKLIGLARNKSQNIYKSSLQRRKATYQKGAYKNLMEEGQVGDVIFKEAEALAPKSKDEELAEKERRLKELEEKGE